MQEVTSLQSCCILLPVNLLPVWRCSFAWRRRGTDSSSTVEGSEELTSEEDFDEDYIRPYSFEPILLDTDTKNNSETESSMESAHKDSADRLRLSNTSWSVT